MMSLLNCAPTPLTHHLYSSYTPVPPPLPQLRAFSIINTRLMRLYLHQYVPYAPFSCVVLFQWEGKVRMFCVCPPINHLPPASLLSFILPYKAV